ncbi:MAG: PmoA family protein [Ferruginibacter sp.]
MRIQSISIMLPVVLFFTSCGQGSNKQNQEVNNSKLTFVKHETENRVDVLVDGKLFTAYWWPDSVYKPILYPIIAASGTTITRGFPIKAREGERRDHIHQVGNWLNYGNVNGYDFWGNGSEGIRNINGGQIKHLSIGELSEGNGEGSMVTTASWVDPAGKELLAEKTVFHFIAKDSIRIIDRITSLTANTAKVTFRDTKEGMFGIRVARQLELPSNEDMTLTDAKGNPVTVKAMSNVGVTGNYVSSEGDTGLAVWGTRAKWMDLYGSIGNENISLVICDHPGNLSYPTYWHARGYGLFSANPLGVKDFTEGKDSLNYSIPAGKSLTFRYRIIISSGFHLTNKAINAYSDDFAKMY